MASEKLVYKLRRKADPPSMKNDHPTLKSVLSMSINQYIPHSEIDTFVIEEVIYCQNYCLNLSRWKSCLYPPDPLHFEISLNYRIITGYTILQNEGR